MKPPASLQASEYLRQRLNPHPADRYYIHLTDLRQAIEQVRHDPAQSILDYGCGGSPYRSLFSAPTYHRADLESAPDLDFVFGPNSRLPVSDQSYDLVLSTQVMEHVRDPATYLRESHRVLKPGGRLIVTTHGLFPDHACPYDYQRWTVDGLSNLVTDCGFKVTRVHKLSTGPRAIAFLLTEHQEEFVAGGYSPSALLLRLIRAPFRRTPAAVGRFCDRLFPYCRVVDSLRQSSPIYIGVMVEAVRA